MVSTRQKATFRESRFSGLGPESFVLKVEPDILVASVHAGVHSHLGAFSLALFNALGCMATLSHNRKRNGFS
jgi:hypothetical protein